MVLETSHAAQEIIQGSLMNSDSKNTISGTTAKAPLSVEECLEVVVAWIEQKAGKNYFLTPLEEFHARYGKVNSEDDFYQARMNYFLEQCVLERPMTSHVGGRTPLSFFIEKNAHLTAGDDKNAEVWRSFCGFRHCLFQVIKTGSDSILVKDLVANKVIQIQSKAGETLQYLRMKSIFQGYIFGHHNQYVLSQGLILHPELANKEILKFIKQHRKSPTMQTTEITRVLAQTNMRYMRMQHVNPTVIYRVISK
jgi:hypothetical protein